MADFYFYCRECGRNYKVKQSWHNRPTGAESKDAIDKPMDGFRCLCSNDSQDSIYRGYGPDGKANYYPKAGTPAGGTQ